MTEWENFRRRGQWGEWSIRSCRTFKDAVRALAFTVVGWQPSKAFKLPCVILP